MMKYCMLIVLLGLAVNTLAQQQGNGTQTRFLGGALNAAGQLLNNVLNPHGGFHRPPHIGGGIHRPPIGGGIHRPPIGGGIHRPPIGGGFGGIGGGFGGIGGGFQQPNRPNNCRYWCRTPQGQAYCCENSNQAPSIVGTKPGFCPPVRPSCPPTRAFGPPTSCSNDGSCGGIDKCCFDTCLQQHTCKTPQSGGFGGGFGGGFNNFNQFGR